MTNVFGRGPIQVPFAEMGASSRGVQGFGMGREEGCLDKECHLEVLYLR